MNKTNQPGTDWHNAMNDWKSIEFPLTLRKTRIGRGNQVPASEIRTTGRYPVIDQGQAFIAGYTDLAEKVIQDELPVVIFGDHTRCVKYVDFPFVLGADGTKVLKPKGDLFDPKFFYYALLNIKLRSRGYNRHFSLLKEESVPCPNIEEQRKIAAVLGLVQRAIEEQDRLNQLTTELKKALLQKLFTEGLHDEPQKMTEIGPVPESWELVRLSDVCAFLSGGTPSKKSPEFWEGQIPWVSPKDIKKPRLRDVKDHISETGLETGSTLAPAGTVFVVVRGMILAKDVPIGLAEVPMAFNQDIRAILPGARVESGYLLYVMEAFKQNLFQKVGRSAHGTMTLLSSEIDNFVVPLPDKQTQEDIALAVQTVEHKLNLGREKHAALGSAFRALLHQLISGENRLLEVDASDHIKVKGDGTEQD